MYPALSVLEPLKNKSSSTELLWVGGEGGMEEKLVQRVGIPFKSIPAAGVHGVGAAKLPGNLFTLMRGFLASRRILREFKPDVLFFTGGYVAAPMALAGRNIPSLVYVPDIEPGLAIRFLARFATKIALTTETSRPFFKNYPDKLVVTGYPIRADLTNWQREQARTRLGLKSDLPVLMVFGGSKGARSINLAVQYHLDALLERLELVHITGETDWETVQGSAARLPARLAERYHPYPYLHEDMGAAYASADLILSRAGASTLGEFPAFGLPAILAPYPYAWRYQKVNADYLGSRGAALMLEDAKLNSGLYLTVEKLLETPEKLAAMREAMRKLHIPTAATQIADLLQELAGVKHG